MKPLACPLEMTVAGEPEPMMPDGAGIAVPETVAEVEATKAFLTWLAAFASWAREEVAMRQAGARWCEVRNNVAR